MSERRAGFAAAAAISASKRQRHVVLLGESERVAGGDELVDVGRHPGDRGVVDLARGEAGLGDPEHDLDLHELVQGLLRMVHDLHAARTDALDQSLELELAERLAHRGRAHIRGRRRARAR